MLKIKDNVDLKELEKYEFIKDFSGNSYTRLVDKKDEIKKQCFVYFSLIPNPMYMTVPRLLYIATPLSMTLMNKSNEYIVDDLIKADLVEKVGSEE